MYACRLNSVIYNVNEISNLHIHFSETLELYIVVTSRNCTCNLQIERDIATQ